MRTENLYLLFRQELEKIMVKDILNLSTVEEIKSGGNVVGFLLLQNKYIDGLYVLPEYRRQGLGRKAVMDYIKKHGMPKTLQILKKNKVAMAFWHGIFDLRLIDSSPIDWLYHIDGLKDVESEA